jgi:RNA polymerase sigma-70 factor (ECF subfamily)
MRLLTRTANFTDQYLILCLQQQDGRGFELLYKKYWNSLTGFAYNYIHNYEAAEEIVQELFIQLYSKEFLLKSITSLKAYLHKALRNRIINYTRDQAIYKKHISKAAQKERSGSNMALSALDLIDMEKKVGYYLSLMSENCRLVFILNREYQLTIRQIAAQLKKPEDTVEKQLRRAVSFLKKNLN